MVTKEEILEELKKLIQFYNVSEAKNWFLNNKNDIAFSWQELEELFKNTPNSDPNNHNELRKFYLSYTQILPPIEELPELFKSYPIEEKQKYDIYKTYIGNENSKLTREDIKIIAQNLKLTNEKKANLWFKFLQTNQKKADFKITFEDIQYCLDSEYSYSLREFLQQNNEKILPIKSKELMEFIKEEKISLIRDILIGNLEDKENISSLLQFGSLTFLLIYIIKNWSIEDIQKFYTDHKTIWNEEISKIEFFNFDNITTEKLEVLIDQLNFSDNVLKKLLINKNIPTATKEKYIDKRKLGQTEEFKSYINYIKKKHLNFLTDIYNNKNHLISLINDEIFPTFFDNPLDRQRYIENIKKIAKAKGQNVDNLNYYFIEQDQIRDFFKKIDTTKNQTLSLSFATVGRHTTSLNIFVKNGTIHVFDMEYMLEYANKINFPKNLPIQYHLLDTKIETQSDDVSCAIFSLYCTSLLADKGFLAHINNYIDQWEKNHVTNAPYHPHPEHAKVFQNSNFFVEKKDKKNDNILPPIFPEITHLGSKKETAEQYLKRHKIKQHDKKIHGKLWMKRYLYGVYNYLFINMQELSPLAVNAIARFMVREIRTNIINTTIPIEPLSEEKFLEKMIEVVENTGEKYHTNLNNDIEHLQKLLTKEKKTLTENKEQKPITNNRKRI